MGGDYHDWKLGTCTVARLEAGCIMLTNDYAIDNGRHLRIVGDRQEREQQQRRREEQQRREREQQQRRREEQQRREREVAERQQQLRDERDRAAARQAERLEPTPSKADAIGWMLGVRPGNGSPPSSAHTRARMHTQASRTCLVPAPSTRHELRPYRTDVCD